MGVATTWSVPRAPVAARTGESFRLRAILRDGARRLTTIISPRRP
jgi:hypothetical protein